MHKPASRYTAVAIALHWAIAAAIVGNIFLGWWMTRAIDLPQAQTRAIAAFQLHKSIGLTILVLSLLRLLWRFLHRPPALPGVMPAWERFAAKTTHWLFYALMIGIPLTGWLYVSTQWRGNAPLNIPTLWFGLIEIPHLFGLNEAAREMRQTYAGLALGTHEVLAWSAALLLALHVAAALKHHFVNRDEVLRHMIPTLKASDEAASLPQDRRGTAVLLGSIAAIAVATTVIAITLVRTPSGVGAGSSEAPAPQSAATRDNPPAIASSQDGWVVDPTLSKIVFAGAHAGVPFQGSFSRWSADIHIDPADMPRSYIAATIETGSASDGIPLHDETLRQKEWFDVANHPAATYRSTGIRQGEGSQYAVEGTLTIKGHAMTLAPLTLTIDGNRATIKGQIKIDRREARLGMESDPDAAWVSREIVVDVSVNAVDRPP